MKRHALSILVLTAAGLCSGWLLLGDDAPRGDHDSKEQQERDQAALRKFMRGKLDASAEVLEGLVSEDFDLIKQGSAQLQRMSEAEKWRVSNDALYRQYSAQFQRVAEKLGTMAEEKKLDGAALTWVEATMNCIECHKHARGILIAGGLKSEFRLSDRSE